MQPLQSGDRGRRDPPIVCGVVRKRACASTSLRSTAGLRFQMTTGQTTLDQQSSGRPPSRPWRAATAPAGVIPARRDNGNRIDNRARGNAAQLLEKYKTLARDAQMQGDRVNTEYYLQFADHYFRVLAETASRFEENRAPVTGRRERRSRTTRPNMTTTVRRSPRSSSRQQNGERQNYQGDASRTATSRIVPIGRTARIGRSGRIVGRTIAATGASVPIVASRTRIVRVEATHPRERRQ